MMGEGRIERIKYSLQKKISRRVLYEGVYIGKRERSVFLIDYTCRKDTFLKESKALTKVFSEE